MPWRRRRGWRIFERALLGSMMGVAAYVIERKLARAVRKMQEGDAAPSSVTFGPEER
jgi:hypothetical protein